MAWTAVWIGGALIVGFYLGMALMSLLFIARDRTRTRAPLELRPGGRALHLIVPRS